jgi:hypothetical protein
MRPSGAPSSRFFLCFYFLFFIFIFRDPGGGTVFVHKKATATKPKKAQLPCSMPSLSPSQPEKDVWKTWLRVDQRKKRKKNGLG